MGFLSVPNLVPWVIFRAWIVTDQFCWISLHFNLTRRDKRKRRKREGRGRGDYLREAINRGMAIIWGNTVLWNLRWALSTRWCNIQGPVMDHTADLETKDQAEATRLSYWVTRLFTCMQSTGDSILARHECRNHWLHPERQCLYVTSE